MGKVYVVMANGGRDERDYPSAVFASPASAYQYIEACKRHDAMALPHTTSFKLYGEPGAYKPWPEHEWRAWRISHPDPEVRRWAGTPSGGKEPFDMQEGYEMVEMEVRD